MSEAEPQAAKRGIVAVALAVVEIVAVVALALVVIRLAQQSPALENTRVALSDEGRAVALRWLPLLGVAMLAEAMVRGRFIARRVFPQVDFGPIDFGF